MKKLLNKKMILIISLIITVHLILLCCVGVAYAGESNASRADSAYDPASAQTANAGGAFQLNEMIYYASHSRSRWLYELMTAAGYKVGADKNDGVAILGLAREYGIVDDYSRDDIRSPLDRRFVCSTLVRALEYPSRSVGYVADITDSEDYMSTAAYFGYFLPDLNSNLYPDKRVSDVEYDALLTELDRYRRFKGKTALSFGDSIMYGTGNEGEGIGEMIALKYGMTCTDFAVPGASFGESKGRGHIPDQIRKAYSKKLKADVIFINGGTNDINHISMGKLSKGFDMEKTSEKDYTGAFERTLWLFRKCWKNVPVIYIRAHNMVIGEGDNESKFGERAMEIAAKWKINAIDLYNDSGLNAEDPTIRNWYTYLNPGSDYVHDSIHPNAIGYAKFYLPPAAGVLDTIFTQEAR